jgi:hypothetical protein
LGGEPEEAELTARLRQWQWRPGKQRGVTVEWVLARTRGRGRGVGWFMVLCEGGTEEGTRRGAAASGGCLFKRCRGEQRGGGVWGQRSCGGKGQSEKGGGLA